MIFNTLARVPDIKPPTIFDTMSPYINIALIIFLLILPISALAYSIYKNKGDKKKVVRLALLICLFVFLYILITLIISALQPVEP